LCSNHGTSVTKGEHPVQVEEVVDDDGQVGRLPRIDPQKAEVTKQVHLKTDETATRVLLPDPLDERDDSIDCRKLDKPRFATVPLLRDPEVNTVATKGTVCDNPSAQTEVLGDSTKRGDCHREGQVRRVQRTNEATVSQFRGHRVVHIICEQNSRRMVPPCTERARRPDHTNIPPVDKTFHDGKKIPVPLEHGGPVDRLEEGM
jgi:hypothetical protein